ncbi:MAG TPA: hypothetical protein VM599_01965, partial [Thermoanaerobaculia bacterium]|nr:hypothetical protein [Thermoanaerobaculia bacterium]
VAGLATADLRVVALPVAAAVAAGAALAGGRPAPAEASPPPAPGSLRHRARWAPAVYALAAAVVLAPLDLAHRAYDRAVDAPREVALRELDRAVARDPAFPLYRARRAWLRGESAAGPPAAGAALERATAEALTAAEAAVGVAPLWLAAGSLAALVDRSRAAAAFERACGLEPLGALAPFSLLEVASPLHQPVALGARSLAAEPRLAAATYWQGRPELLRRSVLTLAATEGIDEGWRAELVARVAALEEGDGAAADRIDELALAFDPRPADSVALHAFRRSPWAARLVFIPVRAGAAAGLAGLPPATALAGTDPRLFPPTCTGAFAPQELRKTLWKSR